MDAGLRDVSELLPPVSHAPPRSPQPARATTSARYPLVFPTATMTGTLLTEPTPEMTLGDRRGVQYSTLVRRCPHETKVQ
jgi:hypothetical protein